MANPCDDPSRPGPRSMLQIGSGWFPEDPGGLERYYWELNERLSSSGMNVTGLVIASSTAPSTLVQSIGTAKVPLLSRWKNVRSLTKEVLATQGIDLVASHFALYAFPILRLVRHLPFVVHFHGPWSAESNFESGGGVSTRARHRLERTVYSRATRLIVLSMAFQRILVEDYRIQQQRIDMVPGGIGCARFQIPDDKTGARRRLGWPTDRPIVLSLRRLVPRMGLEHLIDSIVEVRKQVPDVLVFIGGRGPLSGDLKARIISLNLQRHVELIGFIPDGNLPLAYRAADVTLVPSVALEGFGLVAAESLAAGTPAVVSPVGGLPEVVSGLSPALVLDSFQPGDIAERLSMFIRNPRLLPSCSQCSAYASERFDWSVIASRVKEVYSRAMNEGNVS